MSSLPVAISGPTSTRHPGRGGYWARSIEVSNTSLDSDRDDKIPIYARDGIPVYWIVNLVDRQIEVYEQPTGASPSPTYGVQRQYQAWRRRSGRSGRGKRGQRFRCGCTAVDPGELWTSVCRQERRIRTSEP